MAATAPQLGGYTTERLIGSGGSADVWLVHDPAGQAYAAKVFGDDSPSAGRREWKALNRHAGAHVVPAIDLLRDDTGRTVLILPYLSGGTLHDLAIQRGGLSSGEVVTALSPIAGVLARMHQDGATHGDLTPRNILFDDVGKPFVTDMGAMRVPAEPGVSEWGSAGYVAPEILDAQPPTSASDVYSLGATAWFALVGEAPQPAALRPRLRDVVPTVSSELEEVISACLALTASARPEATDVQRRIAGSAPAVALPLDRHRNRPGTVDPTDAAVAFDARGESADAMSMTRRLRLDAQRTQQGRQGASSKRTSRVSLGRSRTGGAEKPTATQSRGAKNAADGRRMNAQRATLTLAALAAVAAVAVFAPIPGQKPDPLSTGRSVLPTLAPGKVADASAPASGPAAAPATPTKSSVTRASQDSRPQPSPAVSRSATLPTQRDVQELLNCRAAAWNASSRDKLADCLAVDSQALADDSAQLANARVRKVTYRGVAFQITQWQSVSAAGGKATVLVQVRRNAFTASSSTSTVRQEELLADVRLVLTGRPGAWRISAWTLA